MIGKISSRGKWKCTRERITRRGKWLSIHEEDSQWWFEVKFATRREKEKRKGKDFENGGGRRKKSGKMEGGELIRIGLDSKSRWWKTFWPRAFHHRTLASRGNSRGKMAPTQRDTENAWTRAIVSNSKAGDVSAILAVFSTNDFSTVCPFSSSF